MYFHIFVVKFVIYSIPYIYVGMQRFIKFLAHQSMQSILGMKFNGPFKYMTASDNKSPCRIWWVVSGRTLHTHRYLMILNPFTCFVSDSQ